MRKTHGKDLMRKLTGGEPPRPPHGLADRIKKEIPERLTVERGPAGLFGAGREALLVAAMLLVVVAASLVGLHMMEKEERATSVSEIADASRGATSVAPPTSSAMALERLQESEPSGTLKKSESKPVQVAARDEFAPERPHGAAASAQAPRPSTPTETRSSLSAPAPPSPPPAVAERPALQAAIAPAETTPATTAAGLEPTEKLTGLAPAMRAAESRAASDEENLARAKGAARQRPAPVEKSRWRESAQFPTQQLDMALGDRSIDMARRAIDRDRLPPPDRIRVEELVNALDTESGPGTGDFGIIVEGGPSPTSPDSRDYMMRVVIRARDANGPIRRILARNAVATIEFDPSNVTRYRVIRGDGAESEPDRGIPPESYPPVTMAEGDRVTTLVELHFAPEFDHQKVFATVAFRYRPESGGAPVEIRRQVSFESFSRNWRTAPTALRFDVLVASWGELLASVHPETENHSELARMVEVLARERPDDANVQELRSLVRRTIRILHAR